MANVLARPSLKKGGAFSECSVRRGLFSLAQGAEKRGSTQELYHILQPIRRLCHTAARFKKDFPFQLFPDRGMSSSLRQQLNEQGFVIVH